MVWLQQQAPSNRDRMSTRHMMKLLVATHNVGKVREYRELLGSLPLEVTYLDAEGITMEVEETGSTFVENAVLKATAYAQASGLWTWADDSGLEVDALDGAPGVFSARYGGPGATDELRYLKLLDALAGVPWERRTARFRCVVALATPEGRIGTTTGTAEGVIAFGPAGANGFGYDPVFYVPALGLTMAQLSPETKNEISHRGQAARAAAALLGDWLPDGQAPGYSSWRRVRREGGIVVLLARWRQR
jgi:XTP/dITP diphosphohydrolase